MTILSPSPAASRTMSCQPRARHRIDVITHSPLAGGWLSGRWRKEGLGVRVPSGAQHDQGRDQRETGQGW
jgi:hypothetical protein